ncbi:MAG: SIR2 family protein [Nitrospirota bacterium]
MTSISDELQTLRHLRNDGKLIPFVGAGLSKPLGLPSWGDLINQIGEELGYDPEVFKCNGNELQLAEYYVETKGSIGPLRSVMDREFNPTDEQIQTSRAHGALVEMKLPLIYTTNYDGIIERAFELKGRPCYTIASIDDIASAPSAGTHVVKFHGTFSDDSSLVLTESSYFERLEFESAMDIKLRADTLGCSLLFLGYSFSDVNVRFMLYKLHKLRQHVKRSGKRMPSAFLTTFGAGEIQRTLLARWDVSVIELDTIDKTRSTYEFLEALA